MKLETLRFSGSIQENQGLYVKFKDGSSTNLHSHTCNRIVTLLLLSPIYTEETWNILEVCSGWPAGRRKMQGPLSG